MRKAKAMTIWTLLGAIVLFIAVNDVVAVFPLSALLNTWTKWRIGKKPTVWYHKGVLRNSISGDEIAGVEGVEWMSLVSSQPLQYASKKIFVYVNKSNRSEPLSSFRQSPSAPARTVNPIRVLEEIVTIIPSQDRHSDFNASIAWPGGREIFVRKGSIQMKGDSLEVKSILTAGRKSGPLRRWVSFVSPSVDAQGRSHEHYKLSARYRWMDVLRIFPKVSMSYRRFGESPAWYAIGKGCLVELTGTRLPSTQAIPSSVQQLISTLLPADILPQHQEFDIQRFSSGKDLLDDYSPWYDSLCTWVQQSVRTLTHR